LNSKLPRLGTRNRRNRIANRKNERGATLFEYAVVFMTFLALVFGIDAFGHALFVYHQLDHATKEATRYAAVRGATCATDNTSGGSCTALNSATSTAGPTTNADVTAYIASITPQSINSGNFTITTCGVAGTGASMCTGSTTVSKAANCDPNSGGLVNNPGCVVSVQIQYTYNFIFPVFGTVPINMSSAAQMVIVH